MSARRPAALADRDDLLDLREGEAEGARLLDEAQHVDGFFIVDPVPVGRASRRRKDALSLIETDRLRRDAGAPGELTDLQAAPVHDNPSLNLSP